MCDVCLVFISILINYSNEFIMQIRMGIENVVCAIVVSLVTINTRRNTQSHTNWWRESYTFIVMRMQKPRADEIIRNKYSNMFPWIHNNPLVYGFVIQYHLWEFIRINSRRRIQSAHAGSGVRQKDKQTEPKKKKKKQWWDYYSSFFSRPRSRIIIWHAVVIGGILTLFCIYRRSPSASTTIISIYLSRKLKPI